MYVIGQVSAIILSFLVHLKKEHRVLWIFPSLPHAAGAPDRSYGHPWRPLAKRGEADASVLSQKETGVNGHQCVFLLQTAPESQKQPRPINSCAKPYSTPGHLRPQRENAFLEPLLP